MTTQRSILMLSIGLALVYVWLRGGFIGTTAHAAQLPTMQPGWEKATFAMGRGSLQLDRVCQKQARS